MQLAQFLINNMEAILAHWESFAKSLLPAARAMTPLALRDHAQRILEAVAQDLSEPQTRLEQSEKSLGHGPRLSAAHTAAETHAILRARSGFDINQLAAEYRALRASVLRKWMDAAPDHARQLDDIVRFNEAIDQALAESIELFSREVEQSRNLLLGMLGHDMRSPLQTIQMTAVHLSALNAGHEVTGAAGRLIRSGKQLQGFLDDLLDFTRTKFGLGIKMIGTPSDLRDIIGGTVDQIRAAYPQRTLDVDLQGNLLGEWDTRRLEQLLTNLVINALKYGAADTPVRVAATGSESRITIEVTNAGSIIEPSMQERIFEPLFRGGHNVPNSDGSLGLGLYIVREIAQSHGGEVSVSSTPADGTVFTVSLPRNSCAV
jgi:signal transduction histidine kinase